MRAEQDQGLTPVVEQAGDGSAFVAGRSHGAEREFVTGGVRGCVQAADEVAVEGVLDAEHHADQPAPDAAQHPGAAVGSVPQLLGRAPDAFPVRRARPGRVAHDDRHQGNRDPGAGGDIRQRRAPIRSGSRTNPP